MLVPEAQEQLDAQLSLTMALISCCSLHGGAKASQKHERVALTPQQDAAQCDICQVCVQPTAVAQCAAPKASSMRDGLLDSPEQDLLAAAA